jgi:hypothetical protein
MHDLSLVASVFDQQLWKLRLVLFLISNRGSCVWFSVLHSFALDSANTLISTVQADAT